MCYYKDINTNANYREVVTVHTEIEVRIDFDQKVISGTTKIRMKTCSDELRHIILDTSALVVKDVNVDGSPVFWELRPSEDQNGQPLLVQLTQSCCRDDTFELSITFATTEKSTGLQWFEPEQTDDGIHPFMFTQGEPVHARSIFPCQDTPSIKTTLDITVRSKLPVVASGVPLHDLVFPSVEKEPDWGVYRFIGSIPICNYLFAIASGNLAAAKIGRQSYVYAAPGFLKECKAEFEQDIESIIEAGQELIFENPWPLYNLVVLPKSFHLGGMENPVFNFYSATVVSGDRENIWVVAHEFSHTYSGNLVTNSSWEHFWLNEGWTVYIEREILRQLRGDEEVTFQAIVGWNELVYGIESYGGDESHETSLVLQFDGKRPDDVMSKIAYEKGYTFLCFLEKTVDRENWMRFIPHYFRTFSQRSLSSEEFKSSLFDFFRADSTVIKALKSVDWQSWLYKPGLPPMPTFQSTLYENCVELAEKWKQGPQESSFEPSINDVQGWTAGQMLVLLDLLLADPRSMTCQSSQLLGSLYGVRSSKNCEVLSRYLRLALMLGDTTVLEQTEEILGQTGRMKFVRPLFEALIRIDNDFARRVFDRYRSFYHPTCVRLVEGVFGG